MRSFLLIFVLFVASFTANADYMYFQVTDDYTSKVGAYEYVSLSYKTIDEGTEVSGSLATFTKDEAAAGQSKVSLDVEDLKNGRKYSIFVELMNYTENELGDGNWSQVGVTSAEPLTYRYGDQAVTSAEIAMDNREYNAAGAVWHGGTIDVPEPTSGMMVMMGFAFLALKRRKV